MPRLFLRKSSEPYQTPLSPRIRSLLSLSVTPPTLLKPASASSEPEVSCFTRPGVFSRYREMKLKSAASSGVSSEPANLDMTSSGCVSVSACPSALLSALLSASASAAEVSVSPI